MKKILDNDYLLLILRVAFGAFFIYAAQSKILNTAEFARAIRAYDIIPDSLSTIPAIFFPWIEMICGICLVAGIFTQSSAVISAGLLTVFTINVFIALFRGLEIDCGCGASVTGIDKVSWLKILENIVLIVILVFISTKESFKFAISNKFNVKL
jgi:uncharacterized membrane protein YphA (DoxX/SURF4 family)